MTVVLFLLVVGCSEGGPSTPSVACTTPDRAPVLLRQAQPDTPPMAQQQGILGDVVVRVVLDGSGAVTSVRIQTSPSAILNAAALAAARASTYQPGLQNCVPGGTLDVTFHFTSQ
jgi:TonB family protein